MDRLIESDTVAPISRCVGFDGNSCQSEHGEWRIKLFEIFSNAIWKIQNSKKCWFVGQDPAQNV
jgi:hypothetical protein